MTHHNMSQKSYSWLKNTNKISSFSEILGESENGHENSPMVHLCGWGMSCRYFTVLLLLLYFYCVYDDIFITYVMYILLNILTLVCIHVVSYNSIKNDMMYFSIVVCIYTFVMLCTSRTMLDLT